LTKYTTTLTTLSFSRFIPYLSKETEIFDLAVLISLII
jgi:hypothetical protein